VRKKEKEKKEMGEGGCMCVVGEKRKERQEGTWVVGKKKKGNKKEKRNEEWGEGYTVYVYGGKKGRVEKERRKKN
jgi:hypothetical protein